MGDSRKQYDQWEGMDPHVNYADPEKSKFKCLDKGSSNAKRGLRPRGDLTYMEDWADPNWQAPSDLAGRKNGTGLNEQKKDVDADDWDRWDCQHCKTANFTNKFRCYKCKKPNPATSGGSGGNQRAAKKSGGGYWSGGKYHESYTNANPSKYPRYKPQDWTCHKCSAKVFGSKSSCYKCNARRPQNSY